jgi:hypothetical protein
MSACSSGLVRVLLTLAGNQITAMLWARARWALL